MYLIHILNTESIRKCNVDHTESEMHVDILCVASVAHVQHLATPPHLHTSE